MRFRSVPRKDTAPGTPKGPSAPRMADGPFDAYGYHGRRLDRKGSGPSGPEGIRSGRLGQEALAFSPSGLAAAGGGLGLAAS